MKFKLTGPLNSEYGHGSAVVEVPPSKAESPKDTMEFLLGEVTRINAPKAQARVALNQVHYRIFPCDTQALALLATSWKVNADFGAHLEVMQKVTIEIGTT